MKDDKALVLANTLDFIQKSRVAAQVRKTHLSKNKKTCLLTEEIIKKTAD